MTRTSKWCINDCDATARWRSKAGRLATNAPMSAKDMIHAGQEGAHRARADRRAEDDAQRVHRQRRHARDEDEADGRRARVEPREQHERPAVRDRSTRPIRARTRRHTRSALTPRTRRSRPRAAGGRRRSPRQRFRARPGRTRRRRSPRAVGRPRAAPGAPRAQTSSTATDADDRARTRKRRRPNRSAYRARIGANTISVTACAAPTRPMSSPFGLPPARSLSRNCTATPTPTAPTRSRPLAISSAPMARGAVLRKSSSPGVVKHADDLPIGHPSRVARRRGIHRNMRGQPFGSYNGNRLPS